MALSCLWLLAYPSARGNACTCDSTRQLERGECHVLGDVQKRKSRRKAEKLVMIGVNLEVSPKASPLFQNCLAQPTPNVVSMTHSAARPSRSRQKVRIKIRKSGCRSGR